MLASRRRSRVACVVKRRLTHGPPSCSLVGDIDTWSRESGQGTHVSRGRRGGRPSPAGNIRVFSLTQPVIQILLYEAAGKASGIARRYESIMLCM